jgi:subtilisin family serine protease
MICQFKSFFKVSLVVFFVICMTSALSWAQGQDKVRKIVIFEEGFVNAPAQQALVEKFGDVTLTKHLPLVNGAAVALPPAAEKALRLEEGVLRIDDDAVVYALPKPTKPGKPGNGGGDTPQPPQVLPWGVNRIDAEYAWPDYTGAGVNVAVVDTGIDYTHPDLDGNCKGGINIINPRKSYKDDNGHGTHVAGIIAAEDNDIGVVGVAPQASLYGVKVLDRRGSGFVSDVIANWCVNNNMDILNMSIGTDSDIQSMREACDAAAEAGLLLVASAGNDGVAVDYPAAYSSTIAVAATNINDARPSWSSPGPEVDIAAPGVAVLSTWKGGGYYTASGTSMASPHVAGTLALNPSADIYTTADDLPPAGADDLTGSGLIDAGESATGIYNLGDDLP